MSTPSTEGGRPPSKALVTGASSGIGAAYARALAALGYRLALVARRRERLERLRTEFVGQYGVDAEVLVADLADPASVDEVVCWIEAQPALDMLVNAAGFGVEGPFADCDVRRQTEMVQVHLVAPMRLTRAALPGMLHRRQGSVVNVSSLGAFGPLPGFAVYGATKAAVLALGEALALELAGTGIYTQVLCPGFTATEFQEKEGADLSLVPRFLWLTPEEVVEESLRCLGRGTVCVPGLANRIIARLARPLGRPVLRWVARRNGWHS